MNKHVLVGGIACVAIAFVAGLTGMIGYYQGWVAPPSLSIELRAETPDGDPVAGATVEALLVPRGETGPDGKLAFELERGIGEEVPFVVRMSRPGFEFDPFESRFVVRRWTRSDAASLHYDLVATLAPKRIEARVEVRSDGEPVARAKVSLGRKGAGRTDDQGVLVIDLGTKLSREAKLVVDAKGFKTWSEDVALAGGQTFQVGLDKQSSLGAADVRVGYESLGRFVPVRDVEATLADRKVGTTDASGRVKFTLPRQATPLALHRAGFLPDPATVSIGGRRGRARPSLFPKQAPRYRVVLLPTVNGSPDDAALTSALPEIEDKLSDYLFSYGCFERADSESFLHGIEKKKRSVDRVLRDGWLDTPLAGQVDVIVHSEVARADRVVLSARVVSVSGMQIGGFAETDRVTKVRRLAERVAEKIIEVFPFEGHLIDSDGERFRVSFGSRGGRGVRRSQAVEVFRPKAGAPEKLESIAKGKIERVGDDDSLFKLTAKRSDPVTGDKVVLLPRAREATFTATLALTVNAGTEEEKAPFADVNVYRDGVWVGTAAEDGTLRVPVSPGTSHEFMFVLAGVEPYRESLRISGGTEARSVLVPNANTRLEIESEPSGARVLIDGRERGTTPLDTQVTRGFRRVRVDKGPGWRAFDRVLEVRGVEANYTGPARIVLRKDVIAQADELVGQGRVDDAIALLEGEGDDHPDYSAIHNLLGGLYLDEKRDNDRAIAAFEGVLARPENRELVNKRFTVTFLNLGRAYYLKGGEEGYERAIEHLETALHNKRFFPKESYDIALHDTLYYLALASHRLYHARPDDRLLQRTDARWRDYFDFFPDSLSADPKAQEARAGAEQFYAEIRRKVGR